MDAIAANPENYRGVCIANDSFTDEEFADLNAGGVRGIRFNFVTHLGGTPELNMMRRVLNRVKLYTVKHTPHHIEFWCSTQMGDKIKTNAAHTASVQVSKFLIGKTVICNANTAVIFWICSNSIHHCSIVWTMTTS